MSRMSISRAARSSVKPAWPSMPPSTDKALRWRVARLQLGISAPAVLSDPFALSLKVPYSYWIVCPKPTAALPKISTFREWLLAEAAEDTKCLEQP